MRRLRTSYVDDWDDMEVSDNPRFHVAGLSIHPVWAMVVLAVATVALVAVLYVNSLGWFTETPWVNWTITGICIAGLFGLLALSVVALLVMARILRRSRIQLARLDGATHDEARSETDRFLLRTLSVRVAVYAVVCVGVWIVLGSPLIFEWASPLTYIGGLAVVVGAFMVYALYGSRIWEALLRIAGRRNQP